MKAYKGFNNDMTCSGFQYKEGATYTTDRAKVCDTGFHACENPIDCLQYYEPSKSVYHEVELGGEIDRQSGGDTKVAATKIKIGAALSIPALCKATFEYVRSKCTNEHNAEAGKTATAGNHGAATAGDFGAATAGDSGAATAGGGGEATAGYRGAATAGDFGAATAGNHGAATAGKHGAATAGDSGAATAGNHGAATAGDSGAATAGDSGAATAGGGGAATSRGSVAVGENGVGTVRATFPKIKGGMGAMLTIAKENEDGYDIVAWKSFVIDGKKFKPDTWYTIRNGEVVKAEEGEE